MRILAFGDRHRVEPDFRQTYAEFVQEIPWNLARHGGNDVVVSTPEPVVCAESFPSGGSIRHVTEAEALLHDFDVVIMWRFFFEEAVRLGTLTLLHSCDYLYSPEWVLNVRGAFERGELYGVDCYEGWHRAQLHRELGIPAERLLSGFTFGVDPETFRPGDKDPHSMLWASDPGRGLPWALDLAERLHRQDRRFRLHVVCPDYAVSRLPAVTDRSAIVMHGHVPSGPRLFDLFATSAFLPYTSCFPEPSCRVVRQSQACGTVVLYPPSMGHPSEFIEDGVTGFVRPVAEFERLILDLVDDPGRRAAIGIAAREQAIAERSEVQALRFGERVGKLLR